MDHLTSKDNKEIERFRALFPKTIQVHVSRSEDGGLVADVLSFPGVLTQADTFSELIDMVNDAVTTSFDVPERYRGFVPSYIPPLDVAANLSIFPIRRTDENVTLQLAVSGEVTR